jgi:hypothetical protein
MNVCVREKERERREREREKRKRERSCMSHSSFADEEAYSCVAILPCKKIKPFAQDCR